MQQSTGNWLRSNDVSSGTAGDPGARNLRRAGVAEGIIMTIGGWRARSVFERYAIVSRSDMNDAILKLQESENRVEQDRRRAEEQQEQISAQIGHNEVVSPKPPHPMP